MREKRCDARWNKVYLRRRVTRLIQWDVVRRLLLARHAHTADLAKATWVYPCVAFHFHSHQDGWDVAKDQNEKSTQLDQAVRLGIPCVNTELQSKKLHDGWSKE
jgi:hypothetical protein